MGSWPILWIYPSPVHPYISLRFSRPDEISDLLDVFGMYRDMGLWAHGHLEDALGPMATCVLRARYGLQ